MKTKNIEVRAIDLERLGISICYIHTDDPASLAAARKNADVIAAAFDVEAMKRIAGDQQAEPVAWLIEEGAEKHWYYTPQPKGRPVYFAKPGASPAALTVPRCEKCGGAKMPPSNMATGACACAASPGEAR